MSFGDPNNPYGPPQGGQQPNYGYPQQQPQRVGGDDDRGAGDEITVQKDGAVTLSLAGYGCRWLKFS